MNNASPLNPLALLVGHAIAQWGHVELQLLTLLRQPAKDQEMADIMWSTVVSFSARLEIIRKLLLRLNSSEDANLDTQLLFKRTAKLYKKRNEIAHGTFANNPGDAHLIPFLAIGKKVKKITTNDIAKTVTEFSELNQALFWLYAAHFSSPRSPARKMAPPASQPPPLVLQLREEEAKLREDQRQREKSHAIVKRLKSEGKLPD